MNDIVNKIKKELYNSFQNLSGIKLSYEYNSNINTHIIEVLPLKTFNSTSYIDLEISFEEKINDLYPNEELVFISSNSLTKINNPEIILDTTLIDFPKFIYSLKNKHRFEFQNSFLSLDSSNNDFSSTNYLAA